jgi:serine/threonine-protein kinase
MTVEQFKQDALPDELMGYEILQHLGQGAGSNIFAASHPQTRQLCAVKHVVCKTDKDQRFVEQLKAEHEVGQKVRHCGLRRTIDLQTRSKWTGKVTEAVLVMELVDGQPLEESVNLSLIEKVDVFIATAHALASLHALGYIHCDLKPANILVCSDGSVKVIDLGQACPAGTKKPRIQGTPDYIAPEQVRCEPVSPRTDVYNLGATMYASLTGQKLPTLYTAAQDDNSFLVEGCIASPRQLNAAVPENLANLVMECVRTRPEKRPADMNDLARRLEVVRFSLERARMAMAG